MAVLVTFFPRPLEHTVIIKQYNAKIDFLYLDQIWCIHHVTVEIREYVKIPTATPPLPRHAFTEHAYAQLLQTRTPT